MDAQGAIDSLLGRLTTVLVNEAQLLGGLRGDVEFINDEMGSMNGLLLHLTDSHNRDNQVRAWMKQVVGLSRECEGNVELYVQYVGGAGPGARKARVLGYLLRTLRFVRTMSVRHRIATRIRELKVRARDVGDRRMRYGVTVPPAPVLHSITDHPAPQPVGPEEEDDLRRRELLYGEPPDTIEQDTNFLLEHIHDRAGHNRALIRIEGVGRVGKTTIARKVYEHPSVASSFDHAVWINHGGLNRGYCDVRKEILRQIQVQRWMANPTENDYKFFDFYPLLLGTRTLIVIDAVNDHEPDDYSSQLFHDLWEDTHKYHPCVEFVLMMTGDYFSYCSAKFGKVVSMKLPGETHPKFFRSRAFGLARCESSHLLAVLAKCYHDNFAAQLFLRLLYFNPHRSTTQMETICRALEENKNNTAKAMLVFSYNELPSHYKSCLMYLSIFPQGHITMRTDLLRRWAAEGLITKISAGMATVDDQAESIFDSLVTRGFICPGETSAAGKIKSFTLNHVVHDFLVTDVGFVDTPSRPELAHRFSISSGIAIQEDTLSESGPPDHGILAIIESLPQSAHWEFLKMLDLQGCIGLKNKHLDNICKMLLLKYLSLRNTDVTQLPKQIEKLQCLKILDIRQTIIKAVATKSVLLPMLKHLLSGKKVSTSNNYDVFDDTFKKSFAAVCLPKSIRRMEKLEVLCHVEVSNNDDLVDLGKLLHLRKLGVILEGKKNDLALLFQQIEKLHGCLRSLSIQMNQQTKSEGELPPPSKLLQSLNIRGITGGLHLWVAGQDQLTKLTLSETGLGEDALRILGKFRILRCLRLRYKSYTESELKLKEEEFKSLSL